MQGHLKLKGDYTMKYKEWLSDWISYYVKQGAKPRTVNIYEKRTIKRIENCKGGICIEKSNNSTVKVIGGVKYIVTVEYG